MSHTDFTSPSAAIETWCQGMSPVASERIPLAAAAGRVLAESLLADRDSPPSDVSAMDGYAVRLSDLAALSLPVAGTARIGQRVPPLPPGAAMKIVTGAAVPTEAQAVVRREYTREYADHVEFARPVPGEGDEIRRQGENLRRGGCVVPAGAVITPTVISSLASFGIARPVVAGKVRLSIIVTGDELLPVESAPAPWQIRDSNGPFLSSLVAACPRLQVTRLIHSPDDPQALAKLLYGALDAADMVVLTGGVSMGDCDYVPSIVAQVGAKTVFHRLPIRPGHPVLGAIAPRGQAILGLPGNPLAVMTGMCVFGRAAIDRLTGTIRGGMPLVTLANPDQKTLKLWWYRLVSITSDGRAELVSSQGSGDVPSAARSDGFVELPPGESGIGPWPMYRWEL